MCIFWGLHLLDFLLFLLIFEHVIVRVIIVIVLHAFSLLVIMMVRLLLLVMNVHHWSPAHHRCCECEWHVNVTLKPPKEEFFWRRHGAKGGPVVAHRGIYQSNEGGDTQGDAVTMYHEGYSFTMPRREMFCYGFSFLYIYLIHGFLCTIQKSESPPSLSTLLPLLLTNTTTTIYNLYSVLLKSNPKTSLIITFQPAFLGIYTFPSFRMM